MDRSRLLSAGKWVIIGLLMASNFLFYLVNDDNINLILAIAILAYSVYEFFRTMSLNNIRFAIRIYLFSFYLLAVLSLFLGVRSLLSDKFEAAAVSLLFIGGDAAMILYIMHKAKSPSK
jgi:hypothetical protein